MAKRGGCGFGIVGCGMVADFHAKAIAAMKGGHLACVFSRSRKNAQRVAKTHGCEVYTDYTQFLAHPGLDIVTIATPSGAHLEPIQKAAKAGKHIVCEKPLEITLERIDKMIQACKQNKVMLSGIFQRRFYEAVGVFKKAVEAGRLGKVTLADAYIKWYRTQAYYDSGYWRGTWKLDGGGAMMNQSIHTIDLLYHLAGDVDWVCAFADRAIHKRIEAEDNAVAIGSIFMRDDWFSVWEFKKGRSNDRKIIQKLGTKSGRAGAGAADPAAISYVEHQKNFEDVVRALKKGTQPMIDGPEGRKSVEIILAIYRSALTGGKPVQLPLKRTPLRKPFR